MAEYKLRKGDKHDYATVLQKVYRRLHATFYRVLGKRERAYIFYRSYRHRNYRAKEREEAPILYMTEKPAYLAGFGHGIGAWRAGLMNAERFGLGYAYTPMVNSQWEEHLGLGEGLTSVKELQKQGYKKVLLPYYDMNSKASRELIKSIIDSYRGRKIIFCNEYEQWTAKGDDIEGDKRLREMFWESPARKRDAIIYKKGEQSVALHIRRGDVKSRIEQGDSTMQRRWLELDYYCRIIEKLRECSENKDSIVFYVFSEGEREEFAKLEETGAELRYCLDMPEERAFLHLCYADLLVTAPSSFSIIAGAINPRRKLVPDRGWLTIPDTEEWIRVREDGVVENIDRVI